MEIVSIIQLLLTFGVSFVFTALLMPWLIELCRQKGLYDQPNERKVHKNSIPRLGGLLFAPAMSIGIVAGYLYLGVSVESSQLPVFRLSTMILMAGLFLIYLIGVLDDLLGLSARVKFAVQLAASAFMPLCGLYINNLYGLFGLWEIPFWAGSVLTVFLCLLIVNSVNLIDGIDGLSSGLSMFALSGFAALFWQLGVESYTLVSLGLIGAVMAFFFFNVFGSERRGTQDFHGRHREFGAGLHLGLLGYQIRDEQPYGVGAASARHDGGDHPVGCAGFRSCARGLHAFVEPEGHFPPRQNARTPLGFGRGLLHDSISAPHSWSATADHRRECRDVEVDGQYQPPVARRCAPLRRICRLAALAP